MIYMIEARKVGAEEWRSGNRYRFSRLGRAQKNEEAIKLLFETYCEEPMETRISMVEGNILDREYYYDPRNSIFNP